MTWRCKACGFTVSQEVMEKHGGFCSECRNE